MNSRKNEAVVDQLRQLPPTSLRPPVDLYERVMSGVARRRRRRAGIAGVGAALAAAAALVGVLSTGGSSASTKLVPVSPASESVTPAPTPTHTSAPTPTASPTIAPAPGVGGIPRFVPQSVSFVSAELGWAYGPSTATDPAGTVVPAVVAVTHDGGRSWTQLPAPASPYSSGESIRFIDTRRGYIFGSVPFTTSDGGRHWQKLAAPGLVFDLQVAGGRLYTAITACKANVANDCAAPELYTSTLSGANFARTPGIHWTDGDRLSAFGSTLYVLSAQPGNATGGTIASTDDGVRWTRSATPCGWTGADSDALAAFSPEGLALVCGNQPAAGIQPKTAYLSLDGGVHWTQQSGPSSLPMGGYVGPLAAADENTWVMGVARGTLVVTHDSGRSWTAVGSTAPPVAADSWATVEFPDQQHVVAVPGDANSNAIVFSSDAGNTWSAHLFIPR